jgi:transposase
MGKSSSFDLRVRIVGEIESGHSCRAAARRFGVSAATAVRLAQRKTRPGTAAEDEGPVRSLGNTDLHRGLAP